MVSDKLQLSAVLRTPSTHKPYKYMRLKVKKEQKKKIGNKQGASNK